MISYQTLTIKVENDYMEKILSLLDKLPKNKIEIIKTQARDIDAFGILKNSDIDPITWQKKIREENDSNTYKKISI